MSLAEPTCRPFSQKPERRWKHHPDHGSRHAWVLRDTRPREWIVDRIVDSAPREPLSSALERTYDESRAMLSLEVGWDDADAQPVSESTWSTAIAFLRRTADAIRRRTALDLPVPTISPCVDGSIDIFWTTPDAKLLVNIQPFDRLSDYYGESVDGLKAKGTFSPDRHDLGFVDWLVKR